MLKGLAKTVAWALWELCSLRRREVCVHILRGLGFEQRCVRGHMRRIGGFRVGLCVGSLIQRCGLRHGGVRGHMRRVWALSRDASAGTCEE